MVFRLPLDDVVPGLAEHLNGGLQRSLNWRGWRHSTIVPDDAYLELWREFHLSPWDWECFGVP